MAEKTIVVKLVVEESDFCSSDLKEVLEDGFHNVGNHTLKSFEIIELQQISNDLQCLSEDNEFMRAKIEDYFEMRGLLD